MASNGSRPLIKQSPKTGCHAASCPALQLLPTHACTPTCPKVVNALQAVGRQADRDLDGPEGAKVAGALQEKRAVLGSVLNGVQDVLLRLQRDGVDSAGGGVWQDIDVHRHAQRDAVEGRQCLHLGHKLGDVGPCSSIGG
jgi:hypothetical protein